MVMVVFSSYEMLDLTVGCKTSSHIHVDEYLISEVLMI